ncbi:chryseobasin-related MNIO class RiPP peptide [Chitinophaga agrisoli]|uniref:chryseobasin-related MNIO class RiPP peptide n=1 Tax=Chitinophaga agrisoli TaxID=2607653 RepID=UPI001661D7BB|nr:hypothetical protein [Chitinophaga agrisoli]
MKLSKSLLSAIVLGIGMHTITSCTKEKQAEPTVGKLQKELQQQAAPGHSDPCPACGMG